MTTTDALQIVFSHIKHEPMVTATGFISRSAQAVKHRKENFYVIGSMGMVSSIALGIAISKPSKKVIALDGDGSVLMNLGHLPMAGALKQKNFYHIVIDNESYESTGGQPSHSSKVALEKIAKASGYAHSSAVRNEAALKKIMKTFLKNNGPSFLLIKVKNANQVAAPRIVDEPEILTKNFKEAIA